MRRILLIGRDGQLGWELRRSLAPLGELTAVGRDTLDLADPAAVRRVVRAAAPDWLVNAAAYTAVDQAEREPERALAVNGIAPGVLAEEAARCGARLVHYSTDYVFDGAGAEPHGEEDPTVPQSAYGRSKLEGERRIRASGAAHWIFRTSWVYGGRGRNFLRTMLRLAASQPELRVVDDQFGAPTWSRLLAAATAAAVAAAHAAPEPPSGIWHLSAAGAVSWHGFAEAIVAQGSARGLCPRVPVRRVSSAEFAAAARRPANSRLSNRRFQQQFGLALPDWEDGLALCLDGMGPPP